MMNSLIYLGIVLLVLGLFGNFILTRLNDQNTKIVTLANIITSMTDEIQDLKLNNNLHVPQRQKQQEQIDFLKNEIQLEMLDDRLYVSDNDDEEDDNDDDTKNLVESNEDKCVSLLSFVNSTMENMMMDAQFVITTFESTPKDENQNDVEILSDAENVEELEPDNNEKKDFDDYNKLTVDQLKKIVNERQLSKKNGKMKKNELIELLVANDNN